MGRDVMVTGGATGIGYAVAARFAQDGDSVLIIGRRPDRLQAASGRLGPAVQTAVCDATDPAAVEALRASLPASVDVLVNNAGGNIDFDRAEPADLPALAASWHANLDANLVSAVLMTALVADRLCAGGSVISIGSIAADTGAGSYGAAKAALASWNIGLAADLGSRGITANVVAPGYTADTEYFRDRLTATRRYQDRTGRPPRRHRQHGILPRLPRRPANHRPGARRQRRRKADPVGQPSEHWPPRPPGTAHGSPQRRG